MKIQTSRQFFAKLAAKRRFRAALLAMSGVAAMPAAQAADGTWTGTGSDNKWTTTTNWSPTGTPGSTTAASFASTESATFSTSGSGTIDLGNFINIKNITFGVGSGNANAFIIGDANDTLNLSNGGAITIGTGVTTSEQIGSVGTIINLSSTASSTYFFTNNSTTAGAQLLFAGNVVGNTAATPSTLTLNGTNGGTISGVISNGTAGGTVALTKSGAGTWTLVAANTYTGTTSVTGGTLKLDFANLATPTNLVNSGSGLSLAGGTLSILGKSAATTNQTFASLTVGAGANKISLTPVGGGTAGLIITAAVSPGQSAHGSVQFGTTGTTTLSGNLTSALLVNTQSDPYATFGTDDWAATSAGGVVQAAAYTNAATGFTATVNNTVTGSFTASTTIDINSLRFADATGRTVTFNTNTLTARGILVASTAGVSALNGSGFIRGSAPNGVNVNDFNIIQNSANDFTLGANLNVNTSSRTISLVKAGTGKLILTNTNGYSAGTFINEGTIQIGANGTSSTTGALGTGNVTNNGALIFNRSNALIDNNVITGTGTLTQSGTGTLTLGGATSSYTGTTTISAGAVSISVDPNIGASAAALLLNGGTLTTTAFITGSHAITVGASGGTINVNASQYYLNTTNRLLGSGTLTVTGGNGTLVMNVGNVRADQTNTYSGNMIIQNGGSFEYGAAGAVGAGATFNVNSNGELIAQGNAAVTVTNAITSNGGTLSFENLGNLGVFGGTVSLGTNGVAVGLRDWYNYATARSGAIGGVISGAGALSVNSGTSTTAGVLTLSGANTYSGATTVTGSALKAGVASVANTNGAFGNNSAITLANIASTTLDITGFNTQIGSLTGGGVTGGNVTLGAAALTIGGNTNASNTSFGGIISGIGGSVIKAGTGTQTFTGANAYTGATAVNAGTLTLSGSGTVGTGASLTMGGGALDLGTTSQTVGAVSITAAAASGNTIQTGSLTGTSYAASNTTGNAIVTTNLLANGAAGLTKTGAGTLTLSGANTYTGETAVNVGTVAAGFSSALGSGSLSIASAATLSSSSNILNVGSITLSGGANIVLGAIGNTITSTGVVGISGTSNLLTINGATSTAIQTYTLVSGTSLAASGISLTGGAVGNQTIALGGNATVGRTTYNFFSTVTALQLDVTGGAFNLTWNGGNSIPANYNWNTTDANWLKDGVGSNIAFFTNDNITIGTPDSITVDAGGITAGTLLLNNGTGSGALTGGALIASSLTKSGAGTFVINNSTTITTSATVSGGTLALGSANTLNVASVAVSGGTLDIGANNQSLANVSLTSGSITGTTGVLNGTGSAVNVQAGSVSAILGGSVGLNKTSSGTVTLSGANIYTGGTTVSAGVLAVGNATALGANTSVVSVTAGAALDLNGTTMTGTNALTLNGTGITSGGALTNSSATAGTYAGLASLGSASSIVASSGNIILSNAGTITGAGLGLTLDGTATGSSIASIIGNTTGGVTKQGNGTWTLSGVNTYTGTTAVNAGTLAISGSGTLGIGAGLTLGGGTLDLGATSQTVGAVSITTAAASGNTIQNGSLTGTSYAASNTTGTAIVTANLLANGAAALTKSGTGTLALNGANTFASSVLAGGTVTLGGGAGNLNAGIGSGSITFQGGTLNSNNFLGADGGTISYDLNNNIVVATGQTGTLNFSKRGVIFGTLTGAGTLNVNLDGNRDGMSGNWSAFTGQVNLNAATGTGSTGSAEFRLNNGNGFAGGKLFLGANVTMHQLFNPPSGTGTETVQNIGELSGATGSFLGGNPVSGRFVNWMVGALSTNSTFAGVIGNDAGGAKLTKVGTGTLTLTGSNLYNGTTTISNGTLQVGNNTASGSLGTAAVTDNAALTFNRSDSFSVTNNITGTGSISQINATGTVNYTGTASVASLFVKAGTFTIGTGGSITTSSFGGPGVAAGDNGTMTVLGTGIYTSNGDFNVGDTGSTTVAATGILNIQDTAAVSIGTSGGFFVGSAFTSGNLGTGTVNQTGGTFTDNDTAAGTFVLGGRNFGTGTGTYNLSAGTATLKGLGYVGGAGTGTLNISGTGVFDAQAGLRLANNSNSQTGSAGTVNLDGGTLAATAVSAGAGTSTFNFNGGTLKASASSTTFMTGLTNAFVKAGGAVIDTQANSVTIGQNLLTDATSTGGGLTKNGTGTLTLTGANTYTGATVVSNGTLTLDNNGTSTFGKITGSSAAGSITVNNTGTLLLSGTGSSDRIGNTTGLTLAGGTFSMEGLSNSSETLGALTLSASSTLDFGSGSGNTLTFSNLSLGSNILAVYNWTGSRYATDATTDTGGPSQDRLLFTTDVSAQTLGQINFYSGGAGSGWLGNGNQINFNNNPTFEVVPVPEPTTIFGALALLGLVGVRELRRKRRAESE